MWVPLDVCLYSRDSVSISKDPALPPSPCLASNTAMASTALLDRCALANLRADVVAKVELD